ncbi:gas vesicle protein [Alkalicoccus chagannorensis]|uniref:gas vesicle protein n=1 Tax=Alkalicoccus chagannorensis TaxID=427072 RepID=UPI000479C9B1|nr:gas vesicle protein [Alkalicoccus chagannorensis]
MKTPLGSNSLVDVLETVLDKGVIIAGDISINLAEVELITIRIRLFIASVDKAKEVGMDWWETDPYFSSNAAKDNRLEEENRELRERLEKLESQSQPSGNDKEEEASASGKADSEESSS